MTARILRALLLPLLILFLLDAFVVAEPATSPRVWTSNDGLKITASLTHLEGDSVTLAMEGGKVYTLPLVRLSEEDQQSARELWDSMQAGEDKDSAVENPTVIFNAFRFGADRDAVAATLESSPRFRASIDESMLARVGLNGFYKVTYAEVEYSVFFDFGGNGRLDEVILRSEEIDSAEYESELKQQWQQMREHLIPVFGESNRETAFPEISEIPDGRALTTDIWSADGRHYYLFVGQVNGRVNYELRCRAVPYEE